MESGLGIISWIIFGALAGWVASLIAGTNREQGWLENIIVGIIGAFLGGFLFSSLTGRGPISTGTWAASSWPSSGRWCRYSSCAWCGAPKPHRGRSTERPCEVRSITPRRLSNAVSGALCNSLGRF
jgi:uncharacterized membrane protein YeaQ/YmgE (transglycosylase-associated protein family)